MDTMVWMAGLVTKLAVRLMDQTAAHQTAGMVNHGR